MRFLNSLTAVAACATAATTPCGPVVDVGYAKYRGVRLQESGVDQFLGMRFAKAPLGDLRFRAPEDPVKETGVQEAFKFDKICVGINEMPDDSRDEDCLFVNVFKPSNATPKSKLPVWLYIQGGGYANNGNNNYNGTEVVHTSGGNIIFVNFNYRVGALGFLASEEVRKDGALNAGLLDQRKVMHWVRNNIAKFGGDPDHVVIHGCSAGGGSVSHHLTAYGGEKDNNLFVGAVPQNPFWPTERRVSEMEFQYSRLLNHTSCRSLNCLRAVKINTFMQATHNEPFPGAASDTPNPFFYWLPVVDDDLVVAPLSQLFDQGRFVRVPMLVGDTTNEGTYFGYNASTESEASNFIKNNFPGLTKENLQEIRDFYPKLAPLPEHNAWFPTAAATYGDSTFTCPASLMAENVARYLSPDKIWDYRFNVLDPDNVKGGLGVPHAFESTAIFGAGMAGYPARSYLGSNAPIIPITMNYYISFIRSLDPNPQRAKGTPQWNSWGGSTGKRIRLQTHDTAMEEVPVDLVKKCALWRGLAPELEQ